MLKRSLVALLSACCLLSTTAARSTRPSDAPPVVTIGYQFGYAYANLIVMKQQATLEKQFPNTKFEWRVVANGATIRDGMLANQIQIGAGGVAPFLIGWDKGVGWKLLGSLCDINMWMVAREPGLRTLKDVTPAMKLGMPAPDSIQAIVLRKAAQTQLGDAHALDNNIVAIPHPLGVQALHNGQLAAHFTNPPFQFEEVAQGGHVVLKSFDVFGKSTLDSVFATAAFEKEHPEFVKAFYRDLVDATNLIRRNPGRAAELLSRNEEGKISSADFKKWLTGPDTVFTTLPHGYLRYARFMHEAGMLSKVPDSIRELELPTLGGAGD